MSANDFLNIEQKVALNHRYIDERLNIVESRLKALMDYLGVEEHSVPQHYKIVKKEVKNEL